jgi:hypothetical protein
LRPELGVNRYPGDSQFDRDTERLDGGYSVTGEKSSLSVAASGARESTQTSELGTTGRTDLKGYQQRFTLGATPRFTLTERLSAGLGANYLRTTYSDGAKSSLYGSRSSSGTGDFRYRITETTSVSIQASAGWFDSDRAGNGSSNRSVSGQTTYAIGERLMASASIGPSWVESRGRTDQGLVYQASLVRSYTLGSIDLAASRTVSPSGFGVLTQQDSISLGGSRSLSEWTTVDGALSALRTSELLPAASFTFADVRYLRVSASVHRRITDQLGLSLSIS